MYCTSWCPQSTAQFDSLKDADGIQYQCYLHSDNLHVQHAASSSHEETETSEPTERKNNN